MQLYFNGEPVYGERGPAGPDGSPIGTIIRYLGTSAPTDYLVCDGSEYDISQYSELAEFFTQQFGASNYFGGDGTTTFSVPSIVPDDGTVQIDIYCVKAVRGAES